MRQDLVGIVLTRVHTKAYANKMAELEQLLGTDSAKETSRVALFFGITITRTLELTEKMGVVMEKTLMAGHELNWIRPFEPDEDVDVTVTLTKVEDRGNKRFATVESVFATPSGEEIQRQISTFLMFL